MKDVQTDIDAAMADPVQAGAGTEGGRYCGLVKASGLGSLVGRKRRQELVWSDRSRQRPGDLTEARPRYGHD